jgi:FkbM family methyltransferase
VIVIDVGCAKYGGDFSIERLIEEFHPDILFGFDPNPALEQLGPGEPFLIGDTEVMLEQKAAWIFDGEVGYVNDSLNSWVTDSRSAEKVPCFDLACFIEELPEDEIVLKMDAEGSEYDLLRHLILKGMDERLKLAWIEWHVPDRGRAQIEAEIGCELAVWNW